jgi:hypothetical protein
MLWGAYGANAVHFSVLQEYVACKLGLSVGPMYQLSDSFHVYLDSASAPVWERVRLAFERGELADDPYVDAPHGRAQPWPLGAETDLWDADLRTFFALFDSGVLMHDEYDTLGLREEFHTSWWREVAAPLWSAWINRDAEEARLCAASDWRLTAVQWLERRAQKAVQS